MVGGRCIYNKETPGDAYARCGERDKEEKRRIRKNKGSGRRSFEANPSRQDANLARSWVIPRTVPGCVIFAFITAQARML